MDGKTLANICDEECRKRGISKAEYYAKARAIKDRLVKIKKAATRLTLGTAIDNYIKVNDSVLSPSTINAYKSYRKTRFKAFIDLDVGKINYQRMVNEEARNYAPKTVHNAWRLVTAALRHADVPVPSINLPQKPKSRTGHHTNRVESDCFLPFLFVFVNF